MRNRFYEVEGQIEGWYSPGRTLIQEATRKYKGAKPPPPPAPPAPSTVAENAAKAYQNEQRRRAAGFSSTLLTGGMATDLQSTSPNGGPTVIKTLLGS